MDVSLYATRLQAEVMAAREQMEKAYDRYADTTRFWSFIDLVHSSNFRIVKGPKDGYVRGETFLTLVAAVIAPCTDVAVVKEVGDAVFLSSPTFRPLFESVLLLDQTAHQLAAIAGSPNFPFAVRAAIGFGVAKRLTRPHEDFLGTPIDRLSRIMAVRSATSNLLLEEEAYQPSAPILKEYARFLTVSDPRILHSSQSKALLQNIYYRELLVDRQGLAPFRDHFVPWRLSV
jgi:hypothetical protein